MIKTIITFISPPDCAKLYKVQKNNLKSAHSSSKFQLLFRYFFVGYSFLKRKPSKNRTIKLIPEMKEISFDMTSLCLL